MKYQHHLTDCSIAKPHCIGRAVEFEPLLVLELCIANILCLTLCDILHEPHIFILVSMRSYKLLLRAGPKAGIITSHSIYPNFELIEIFNKTGGM